MILEATIRMYCDIHIILGVSEHSYINSVNIFRFVAHESRSTSSMFKCVEDTVEHDEWVKRSIASDLFIGVKHSDLSSTSVRIESAPNAEAIAFTSESVNNNHKRLVNGYAFNNCSVRVFLLDFESEQLSRISVHACRVEFRCDRRSENSTCFR